MWFLFKKKQKPEPNHDLTTREGRRAFHAEKNPEGYRLVKEGRHAFCDTCDEIVS